MLAAKTPPGEGTLMGSERLRFFHRFKENGSFDSICMSCFRKVDTQMREAELSAKEQTHVRNRGDVLPLHEPHSWIHRC
jgi:hypothetical protein